MGDPDDQDLATLRVGRARRGALAGWATALASVSLLHPVLDLLGRNPEFFVARASPRTDAIVVAVTVGVAIPLLLWVCVRIAGRAAPAGAVVVAAAIASLAGGVIAVQVAPTRPAGGAVVGALGAAAATVLAARVPAVWDVLRWGAAVPLASLALYLAGPVSAVLAPAPAAPDPSVTATAAVPVTVVILDELPTASLLDGPISIDPDRYPNLARFAEDAVWYRNATTVADRTSHAVPAILTGMRTPADALPIAANHPQSIHTLLAPSHDVHVVEPVTAICPPDVCGGAVARPASTPSGASALLADVRLVAAHVLLPAAWAADLPAIDRTWGGFDPESVGEEPTVDDGEFDFGERILGTSARDRRQDLRDVIRPADGRPPAYVLHTMLPHVPYRYLPSGQELLPAPLVGLEGSGVWIHDRWIRDHAHRQHLLQAGLADRVVGEVLDDLRDAGLYEDAIIAVVSDHGVAFRGGADRRRVERSTLPDIAAVPLLVRYPDGPRGVVDHRPVETIDLVPTLADVLGIEPTEPFDGVPLTSRTARPATRTLDAFGNDLAFTPDEADPWRVAGRIRSRFGEGWSGLYASVPDADLIGRNIADLDVGPSPVMLATVDHRDRLRRSTPASDPVVGTITGGLAYAEPPTSHVRIAVAFDHVVVAVGRTTTVGEETAAYQALIAPRWYAGTLDRIDVYVIDGGRLMGPLLDPSDPGTGR